jgi:hypothetical protein
MADKISPIAPTGFYQIGGFLPQRFNANQGAIRGHYAIFLRYRNEPV